MVTRMKTSRIVALVGFLLSVVPDAQGGAMENLAASMAPGTWAQLSYDNANINSVLGSNGASGTDFGYTDDIVWDPVTRQLFFAGGDHAALPQFDRYTESTNLWQEMPRPTWMPSSTMHGYDHSAIDPQRRFFYHRPFADNRVHRYNIDTGSWTQLPAPPAGIGESCCDALEYFPELGGLVWNHYGYSTILLYREATASWINLGTASGTSTWQLSEYNPVRKVLVFSMGDNFYQLSPPPPSNPSGPPAISSLGSLPVPFYDGSGYNGVLTVDPVSGDYLILSPATRRLHVYDLATRTARLAPSQPPSSPGLSGAMIVATPVSTFGVVVFVHCQSSHCGMLLYKHAAGTAPSPPASPTNLRVQ